jgi:hypothetical protein
MPIRRYSNSTKFALRFHFLDEEYKSVKKTEVERVKTLVMCIILLFYDTAV